MNFNENHYWQIFLIFILIHLHLCLFSKKRFTWIENSGWAYFPRTVNPPFSGLPPSITVWKSLLSVALFTIFPLLSLLKWTAMCSGVVSFVFILLHSSAFSQIYGLISSIGLRISWPAFLQVFLLFSLLSFACYSFSLNLRCFYVPTDFFLPTYLLAHWPLFCALSRH